jgi:hypothetical protein
VRKQRSYADGVANGSNRFYAGAGDYEKRAPTIASKPPTSPRESVVPTTPPGADSLGDVLRSVGSVNMHDRSLRGAPRLRKRFVLGVARLRAAFRVIAPLGSPDWSASLAAYARQGCRRNDRDSSRAQAERGFPQLQCPRRDPENVVSSWPDCANTGHSATPLWALRSSEAAAIEPPKKRTAGRPRDTGSRR